MTKLGFEPESLAKFEKAILKPYGMVLVTGPTGSGKTNTLYSAICALNKPETNIMTAEDPVEFKLAGINQVQMKEQIGLNFAAALRSFLRQDPNIILVGEIRDFETAEIADQGRAHGPPRALHAAHQRCAVDHLPPDEHGHRAVPRGDFREPHLAQRLIRRICADCKEPVEIPPQALIEVGFTPEEAQDRQDLSRARAAAVCNNTGYKGRVGLVRSDGNRRRDPRADPGRRFGPRDQEEGDRAGHDHPAPQRA